MRTPVSVEYLAGELSPSNCNCGILSFVGFVPHTFQSNHNDVARTAIGNTDDILRTSTRNINRKGIRLTAFKWQLTCKYIYLINLERVVEEVQALANHCDV